MAQAARDLDQLLHRVIGRSKDSRGQEKSLDVIAPVEIERQPHDFVDHEARPRHARAAIDTVLAIVEAEVGQQQLEQRNAAAVRRITVAGPIPVVEPMPASPVEPRDGALLDAHKASYFAASARIESLRAMSIGEECGSIGRPAAIPHIYTVNCCTGP